MGLEFLPFEENKGKPGLRSMVAGFIAVGVKAVSRHLRADSSQNPVWEVPPLSREDQQVLDKERLLLNKTMLRLGKTLESSFGFDDPAMQSPEPGRTKMILADTTRNGSAYRITSTFTGDNGVWRSSVYRIHEFESGDTEQLYDPQSQPDISTTLSLSVLSPQNTSPPDMQPPECAIMLSTPQGADLMCDIETINSFRDIVIAHDEMAKYSSS